MRGPLLELYETGVLQWGAFLQAHEDILQPGPCDRLGAIVVSLDQSGRVTPKLMVGVARQLMSTVGTKPKDPNLRAIANYLTRQMSKACGLKVPQEVSQNVPCMLSTTILRRDHLPGRILMKQFFPVVTSPKSPHHAMLLPEKFWPEEMQQWWYN